MAYERHPTVVEEALYASGTVVVIGRGHARNPQDVVNTVKAVHGAGYVPEVTFRIDEGILREAMEELTAMRARRVITDDMYSPILGVGSVINPQELESAIEMGFDMVVSPDSGMGGYGDKTDFVKIARKAGVFCAPAAFSPSELSYWLEREDGLEPDAIKIFPASVYGPKGLGGLLAPYQRERHTGRIIMPTGGVDRKTGPEYQQHIAVKGFRPVLGMSDPLKLVLQRNKPGDMDTLKESLEQFQEEYAAECW
ncbi:MAG: bifunctional 4-hydroxy-2-oxoglutarate aldolase/2-dehydro-3-deoxy-phosphogluconate aldolase [Candidatus Aenigmatarchaeota archaeon]